VTFTVNALKNFFELKSRRYQRVWRQLTATPRSLKELEKHPFKSVTYISVSISTPAIIVVISQRITILEKQSVKIVRR